MYVQPFYSKLTVFRQSIQLYILIIIAQIYSPAVPCRNDYNISERIIFSVLT